MRESHPAEQGSEQRGQGTGEAEEVEGVRFGRKREPEGERLLTRRGRSERESSFARLARQGSERGSGSLDIHCGPAGACVRGVAAAPPDFQRADFRAPSVAIKSGDFFNSFVLRIVSIHYAQSGSRDFVFLRFGLDLVFVHSNGHFW